jgi:ketopantoate reductase
MRVLIVGTGVIGTVYGSLLADAGHSVTHLVRPGAGSATGVRALSISLLDGRASGPREREFVYPARVTDAVIAAGIRQFYATNQAGSADPRAAHRR